MTYRRISLLSILLMATSAITAAIFKSNDEDQTNSDNNGLLLVNSGAGGAQTPAVYSCVIGKPYNCHLTDSGTRVLTYVVTFNNIYTTRNNTSLSIPWNGIDTTSELIAY